MKSYPLVFSFRDLIAGKGFIAGVGIDGRVLLVEENDGDVWMYGVQPGGVSGGGQGRAAAFQGFKNGYSSVLFDIAAEVGSFAEFKREVTNVFDVVNAANARDWDAALLEVRRTQANLDGVPTVKGAHAVSIEIVEVDETTSRPSVNGFDQIAEAA